MPKWSSQLWIELVYKKSILISSEPSYFLVIDYVKNKQTNNLYFSRRSTLYDT